MERELVGGALVLLALLLVGCGGAATRQGHEALNLVTDVADPTYELAMRTCDELRDAIVAREGTTYEQDRAAMDSIHDVCDPIVTGFEALRGTQLTARAALDEGLTAAAEAAIREALALWPRLQAMVRSLQELGTSGGES